MAHVMGGRPVRGDGTVRGVPPSQPPPRRSFVGFLKAVQETASPATRLAAQYRLHKDYGSGYRSERTAGVQKAAMGEESGSVGGYLLPVDYTAALLESLVENSFIYPRANVIPMATAEVRCPRIDVETVPANPGVSPFLAGMSFSWGSGQAPAETEPTFREARLKAWDLLGYAIVSNQLLADTGPEGEEYLVRLFGKAAAWYAEYAFLRGTGAAQLMPLGLLNAPAALAVNRATPNQITAGDIANMGAAMIPYGWQNAVWAVSPTCLAQLVKVSNFFLNQGKPDEFNCGYLLTRPVFITEKLPPLGTPGDLVFFDPSLYVIGSRQEVLVDVSAEALFRSNQTVFRVWLRLDGRPQLSAPVTLADGTTRASSIVVLN
jgi:HK97 family phage major capsid protein